MHVVICECFCTWAHVCLTPVRMYTHKHTRNAHQHTHSLATYKFSLSLSLSLSLVLALSLSLSRALSLRHDAAAPKGPASWFRRLLRFGIALATLQPVAVTLVRRSLCIEGDGLGRFR